jgi:3-methylfumaryl-CoA hydratase
VSGYDDWVGRSMVAADDLTAGLVEGFRVTLDQAGPVPAPGEAAPLGIHWLLAPERAPQGELGPDGHPRRGRFLPPIALPRRMWAASTLELLAPLRVGDRVERQSRIAAVSEKTGRSGPLAFVEVDHRIVVAGEVCLRERQTIVYRGAAAAAPADARPAGDWPWRRDLVPDPVLLFRYSALTFNGHRIHYDRDYVTKVEGYPGLIFHGPLQAAFIVELAAKLRGSEPPKKFVYRGLQPLFEGSEFSVNANDNGASMELWTANSAGQPTMKGTATW